METSTSIAEEQPQTAVASFGVGSPHGAIARATEVATAVAAVIESRQLFTMIQRKKYVRCEGWTTMGALLGVFPQIEWSRPVEREGVYGYEARAVVKTLAGATISSGDAECWSDERNWSNRDRYALRSMAETRATGKAMRVALSWVMALAGYEVTPAEEMPTEPFPSKNPTRRYVAPGPPGEAPVPHVAQNTPQTAKNGTPGPLREDQASVDADIASAFPEAESVVAKPKAGRPKKIGDTTYEYGQAVKLVAACSQCGEGISDAVLRYSEKQFGSPLCFPHQKITRV